MPNSNLLETPTETDWLSLGESVGYAFPDTVCPTVKRSAVQTNCKNCAAPLKLQIDKCEYCKTPIIEAEGKSA
jgi:hypothetical protein